MKAISRVLRNCIASFGLALACAIPWAYAQTTFPDKPLQVVVPVEAGGAADVLARLLATNLSSILGQPVGVVNKPGDGTALAAEWLTRAEPDGYTLMLANISTLVLNPAVRKRLGYDPVNSFTHLGMVADLHLLMLSAPDGPASMEAVIRQAKDKPRTLAYGSAGVGSAPHFAGEMLKAMTDAPLVHVPADGSVSNLRTLMERKVLVASDTETAALAAIRAGKIRALATFSPERIRTLPDVPTMTELGYPELALSSWLALVGPKNLPGPVRQRLENALSQVASSAEFRTRVREAGMNPIWGDGATVVKRIRLELPKVAAMVQLDEIKY